MCLALLSPSPPSDGGECRQTYAQQRVRLAPKGLQSVARGDAAASPLDCEVKGNAPWKGCQNSRTPRGVRTFLRGAFQGWRCSATPGYDLLPLRGRAGRGPIFASSSGAASVTSVNGAA